MSFLSSLFRFAKLDLNTILRLWCDTWSSCNTMIQLSVWLITKGIIHPLKINHGNIISVLMLCFYWSIHSVRQICTRKNHLLNYIYDRILLKSVTACQLLTIWMHNLSCFGFFMLCTAQLPGPVLKAFGRAQFSPLQLADKSPMITDHHTAGGSVSQSSQLAKLSPWLTLSTKDITTSFWHYKKSFCFLSNQIVGLYHFSNPTE